MKASNSNLFLSPFCNRISNALAGSGICEVFFRSLHCPSKHLVIGLLNIPIALLKKGSTRGDKYQRRGFALPHNIVPAASDANGAHHIA